MKTCDTCLQHRAVARATSTTDPTDTWVVCTKCRATGTKLKASVAYGDL